MILLQFVIEHGSTAQGLGLDVGDLAKADFNRLGMTRTSLVWKNGSDPNVADGWNDQGQPQPHEKRSKVRVAGSMNTSISDLSKFAAALVRGDGLSPASRAEMTKPSLHITTAGLFPLFQPDLPLSEQRKDLASGLGVTVFDGPQGHGFFKGGHDGQTANTLICIEASQRCVLILSNDVRSRSPLVPGEVYPRTWRASWNMAISGKRSSGWIVGNREITFSAILGSRNGESMTQFLPDTCEGLADDPRDPEVKYEVNCRAHPQTEGVCISGHCHRAKNSRK